MAAALPAALVTCTKPAYNKSTFICSIYWTQWVIKISGEGNTLKEVSRGDGKGVLAVDRINIHCIYF